MHRVHKISLLTSPQLVIIVVPLLGIPLIFGMTFVSFPFAFAYKFLALDNIEAERFRVTLEQDPDIKDFVIPWWDRSFEQIWKSSF